MTLDAGVGEVTATAGHRFWVIEGADLDNRPALKHVNVQEDRGQALPGRWVHAEDLRDGDVLFLRGRGPATLHRVWHHDEHLRVCNLTVERLYTYAVGAMQALVHNTCPGAPRKTLTPAEVTKGMEISPSEVNIYRGGNSLNVRPTVDIQIDNATGLVKPTHGLSLDVDAAAMQKFGGAYRVESIPPELKIIQRGNRLGHFEIVPREAMTPERFQELSNQIKLVPAGE